MAFGGIQTVDIITDYRLPDLTVEEIEHTQQLLMTLLECLSCRVQQVDAMKREIEHALEKAECDLSFKLEFIKCQWAILTDQQRRNFLIIFAEECRQKFSFLRDINEDLQHRISLINLGVLVEEFLAICPETATHRKGRETINDLWTKLTFDKEIQRQFPDVLAEKQRQLEQAIEHAHDPTSPDNQRYSQLNLLVSRVALTFVGLKIALVFM